METIKILNPEPADTVVIVAANIKEAKEIAKKSYKGYEYVRPYHYSSKGNNFYTFVSVGFILEAKRIKKKCEKDTGMFFPLKDYIVQLLDKNS